jgi:hypothetical protein
VPSSVAERSMIARAGATRLVRRDGASSARVETRERRPRAREGTDARVANIAEKAAERVRFG